MDQVSTYYTKIRIKIYFVSRSIPGIQSEKIDPAAVGHVTKDVINSNLKVRIQQVILEFQNLQTLLEILRTRNPY